MGARVLVTVPQRHTAFVSAQSLKHRGPPSAPRLSDATACKVLGEGVQGTWLPSLPGSHIPWGAEVRGTLATLASGC